MVRFLLFASVTISTFGLGSWAYKINYESRAASLRVKSLEKAIQSAKKERKLLEAEWAHLNSPDRLRKLVEYYFYQLRLNPINPDDFISFSEVYWDQSSKKGPTASVGKRFAGIEHDE